jgi:UDP-N-acetylmuramate dehydrogenase
MQDFFKQLKEFGKVKLNEAMNKHTTFKIGGPVHFFVIVEENDKLVVLLNFLVAEGVSFKVISGGSNMLFPDEEFEGVVVQVKSQKLKVINEVIEVEAGVALGTVVNEAAKNSLSGLEWAAGIPGTIGGAVRGNAGAYGLDTGRSVEKVEVWQDGEVKILSAKDCDFGYRSSLIKRESGIVVLRAWFKLVKGDKKEILKKIQENISSRNGKYPPFPSAGCFFTNVKLEKWPGETKDLPSLFLERGTVPAGWLVEQVEAKGLAVGGAKVSDEHANFVVNFNKATAEDVKNLVEEVKQRVYNKYRVELEFEVEIV